MKTLIVGDLHLKAQIILPLVEKKARELKCRRVILLGDYLDAYGQNRNVALYMNELDYLLMWKSKMQVLGIEVVALLGNHDAPYLVYSSKDYSLRDADGFISAHQKLLKLQLQVAFELDDFLVSHAGFTEDYQLEEWQLHVLTEKDLEKINWLSTHVGTARGGTNYSGSPIWADFSEELTPFPNSDYPKQIVGHTPQKTIRFEKKAEQELIAIDTFTVFPQREAPYIEQAGSGEILLYEDGKVSAVQLDWRNEKVLQQLDAHFDRWS